MQQIYTIGHSAHSIKKFIELLQRHEIEVVGDVRSQPYSTRFPQFSKESLQASLKSARIRYVFLGRELGARREETECYVNGQAVYEKIAQLPAFTEGIARVLVGAHKYRVALMCAEQDPLTCHRTILVCHELKKHDVSIRHISRTGILEDHQQTEQRLIEEELGRTDQTDMFSKSEHPLMRLEQAYARRASSIAYRQDKRSDDHSHDWIHTEVR